MSLGSVFHSLGGFFTKLFNSAPSWAQKASATIKFIAPLATTIVQLAAGPDAAKEAQAIAAEVQVDLALASKLISDAHGGTLDKVALAAALNSLQTNLNELLSAGHIKNPELLQKISVPANLIIAELQAILSELPHA